MDGDTERPPSIPWPPCSRSLASIAPSDPKCCWRPVGSGGQLGALPAHGTAASLARGQKVAVLRGPERTCSKMLVRCPSLCSFPAGDSSGASARGPSEAQLLRRSAPQFGPCLGYPVLGMELPPSRLVRGQPAPASLGSAAVVPQESSWLRRLCWRVLI